MSGRWSFEVTQDDLDAMDGDTFDAVWTAIGIVLRARRTPAQPERFDVAAPAETSTTDVTIYSVADPVIDPVIATAAEHQCPECGIVAKNGTGLSAHRRSRHAPKPRKKGSARIEEAKQAEREAVAAAAAAIRGREPQPTHVNGQDFTARAAARHADAWAERHVDPPA